MSSMLGPLWGSFVCADADLTRSCMRCSDSIVMMAVFAVFVLGRGILYMSTCSLWTKSSKRAFVLILVFVLSTDGGGWTVGTIPKAHDIPRPQDGELCGKSRLNSDLHLMYDVTDTQVPKQGGTMVV